MGCLPPIDWCRISQPSSRTGPSCVDQTDLGPLPEAPRTQGVPLGTMAMTNHTQSSQKLVVQYEDELIKWT